MTSNTRPLGPLPPPAPSPYTVDARFALLTARLTRLEGELAALRRWVTAREATWKARSRP